MRDKGKFLVGKASFQSKSMGEEIQKIDYEPSKRAIYFPLPFNLLIIHALGILGIILFPPKGKTLLYFFLVAYLLFWGLTLGFHRCLAHHSFDFKKKWMERVIATLGTVNLQFGPIWWCSIHRLHHKYSDSKQDPHNSRRGFFYPYHLFWLSHLDPRYKPWQKTWKWPENVKDLTSDPYYRWLEKFSLLPPFLYLLILLSVGGWQWFFWGGILPILYSLHLAFAVNTLAHFSGFGYRSFKTKPLSDGSKNNFLMGIVAMGEGWHNNHHAFPSSPYHGFFNWWELDVTYLIIKILEFLGIVHNLKLTPEKQIEEARVSVPQYKIFSKKLKTD